MELKDIWNKEPLGKELPKREIKLGDLKNRESKHPLEVLNRHLKINQLFAYVIIAGYLIILYLVNDLWIRIPLLIIIGFTIWMAAITFKFGKKIQAEAKSEKSILSEIKTLLSQFEDSLQLTSKVALFFYPISITAGFFFGGISAAEISVEEFMSQEYVQWALVISIVVLTPLSYFAARWANQWAFGKHIRHLKNLIEQIEENDSTET